MNKLLNSVLCVCTLLFSFSVYAEQALSKALIQQYTQATEQLDKLLEVHPDLEKQLDDLILLDKAERLTLIKSLPVYPKIKSIVTNTGFDDVEEFLDIGLRVMGATVKLEMDQMPNNMTIDSYIEQMKKQLSSMKKEGIAKEMVDQMEATINMQISSMEAIQQISKNASEADIKFVNDNIEWVTQVMESEEE